MLDKPLSQVKAPSADVLNKKWGRKAGTQMRNNELDNSHNLTPSHAPSHTTTDNLTQSHTITYNRTQSHTLTLNHTHNTYLYVYSLYNPLYLYMPWHSLYCSLYVFIWSYISLDFLVYFLIFLYSTLSFIFSYQPVTYFHYIFNIPLYNIPICQLGPPGTSWDLLGPPGTSGASWGSPGASRGFPGASWLPDWLPGLLPGWPAGWQPGYIRAYKEI